MQSRSREDALAVTTETLHNRLVTRESGGARIAGRGSLARCSLKYRDFLQKATASSQPSADELRETASALRGELMLHQLEAKKLVHVYESAEVELLEYREAQEEIQYSIDQHRRDIEQLKLVLFKEKRTRREKEEYEALARLANRLPSKRRTRRKLNDVGSEMNAIRREESRTANELQLREKQFQLLLQCIFDLKSTLAEDEEQKEFQKGLVATVNDDDMEKTSNVEGKDDR